MILFSSGKSLKIIKGTTKINIAKPAFAEINSHIKYALENTLKKQDIKADITYIRTNQTPICVGIFN